MRAQHKVETTPHGVEPYARIINLTIRASVVAISTPILLCVSESADPTQFIVQSAKKIRRIHGNNKNLTPRCPGSDHGNEGGIRVWDCAVAVKDAHLLIPSSCVLSRGRSAQAGACARRCLWRSEIIALAIIPCICRTHWWHRPRRRRQRWRWHRVRPIPQWRLRVVRG